MARPRNLKNYKPPVEMLSTEQLPRDPSPEEIRRGMAEIQETWSEQTREARRSKRSNAKPGSIFKPPGWNVPTVSVGDWEAAAR